MKLASFHSICVRSLAAAAGGFAVAPGAAACPPAALVVARTLEVGTSGGLQVGLKTYPQTLALDDREIVLTFDDGPAPQTTPKILDALAAECVKATFFLVGRNAKALPAVVKREVAEGHTVAHHSFSHPAATLRNLSEKAAQQEILRGFEADDKAAYGAPNGAPKVRFFRFPGFADTPELVAWLSAQNIAVFGADFWASDWVTMTPQAQLALILSRLEQERRGILLLHDTKKQTAAMLPDLLKEIKKRNYRIVNIVPGAAPPPTRAAPEGWTSATDKIIADVFAKARAAKGHGAKPRGPAKEGVDESGPGGNPSPQ
ncbi:MAG: polysaccharide deacetylase family protein [Methylocella sp.]